MRNLASLIENIIIILPDFDKEYREKLIELRKSAYSTPPELSINLWKELDKITKKQYIGTNGMIKYGSGLYVLKIMSLISDTNAEDLRKVLTYKE